MASVNEISIDLIKCHFKDHLGSKPFVTYGPFLIVN